MAVMIERRLEYSRDIDCLSLEEKGSNRWILFSIPCNQFSLIKDQCSSKEMKINININLSDLNPKFAGKRLSQIFLEEDHQLIISSVERVIGLNVFS